MCRCQERRTVVAPIVPIHRRDSNRKKRANTCAHEETTQGTFTKTSLPPNILSRDPLQARHLLKIVWDVLTILISLTQAYTTHTSIRDRCFLHVVDDFCSTNNFMPTIVFGQTRLNIITTCIRIWFALDILLNFLSERRSRRSSFGTQTFHRQYWKTWFLVDAISLIAWENILVQPIFHQQHKQNVWMKLHGLIKGLKKAHKEKTWRHFPVVFRLLKRSARWGLRPVRVIMFLPNLHKYIIFFHEMKVVLAVRGIRQIRWIQRLCTSIADLF